jgi:hypothetical protein
VRPRFQIARAFAAALGVLAAALAGAARAAPVPDGFSVAMVGDIIYVRPSLKVLEASAPGLLKVLRGADVSFGNFESNAFALKGFAGSLQTPIDGPALLSPPPIPTELRAMGFSLLSHANNHAFDWGAPGVLATGRNLTRAGLVHAGSGGSLAAARAPRGLTVRGTRVALVAATASFPDAAPAADAWGPVAARPGVDALHLKPAAAGSPGLVMDEADEAAVLDSVRRARGADGLVMLSLHTHQPAADDGGPPAFEVAFAHRAIDSGADIFVAQGPHQLRGIEIYKGRPIFYSLANFAIMQPSPDINPTPLVIAPGSLFTRPAFIQSVIAVDRYRGGRLSEIRLYPFELAQTGQLATHGLPHPVSAEAGHAIIARLAELSRPFGTQIIYEDGVGVIHLSNNTGG